MKNVRVRYAPSPTGHLHIGNARTALFNYLFARKYNGKFIVRIEDTDTERNVEGGVESQLKYLEWLGIDWDESVDKEGEYGPYNQLSRLGIYKKYADILLEKGLAYKCYCTQEELEKERDEQKSKGIFNIHYSRKCLGKEEQKDLEYTIRFKVPENKTYEFNDIVKSNVKFESKDIGDWVIMKRNGIPTYNFACAIDDHLMEISHVLRGEDHITNTPKQMMIYEALGFPIPTFCHMTLIVNEDKKKLSKRDESIIQFIEQYAELGYLPEALFNFITLLGWSPEGKKEIMSKEKFIKIFDEKRLSTSPATFDKEKLKFINNRYIKDLELEEFIELCMPHLIDADINKDQTWIKNFCDTFKDRVSSGSEIVDCYDEFVNIDFKFDDEMKEFLKQEGVKETLDAFYDNLKNITWDSNNINNAMKEAGVKTEAKGKMLFMPCRIATTAQMHGPDLPKALVLLGKEETLERLKKTINNL